MPNLSKSTDNLPTISDNLQKSCDSFNVGSKKWHFAIADELCAEASAEKDKEQASSLKERALFHRLIGENQK